MKVGVGHFAAWDGGCLFIGRHNTPVPVHAHQAMQVMMGMDGNHLIRAGALAEWKSYAVAAIPSRQPHSIDVTQSRCGAVILIEPETREGRAITQRYLDGGIAEVGTDDLHRAAQDIFAAWMAGSLDVVVQRTRALVHTLAAEHEPAAPTDARLLNGIAYINAHLSAPITLDAVASHANLSPSRFRHLFAEQVGMGLRPYILWRRFILAWGMIMRGATLSTAAHAAGFADAAHLSRTCVRAFGFPPSALQFLR